MADESVMAPVLSQPSLPFPVSIGHKAALGISDEERVVVITLTALMKCAFAFRQASS